MKFIRKLFPTILILSCFFLIGLCLQEVVLAGTIQLPKTGQITCYDTNGNVIPCAGTGQDGNIRAGVAWPNPRFTVSGDCVGDNLTGLVWAKNANLPNGTKTWQGALDYVASLNSGSGLCGYHDWRLPNINEFDHLGHDGQSDSVAWLNSQGFTNVQVAGYWSSTSFVPYSPDSWLENIGLIGMVGRTSKTAWFYIWPVRSSQTGTFQLPKTGQTKCYDMSGTEISCSGTGQDGDIQAGVAWPNPRFSVSGDCVTDNLTGLIWAKNANLPGNPRTWQGALDYAASLNSGAGLCGHHDWRLPNRKELRSLIDYSRQSPPALPLNHPFINVEFSNVQSLYYWSSTSASVASYTSWKESRRKL